MQNWMQRKQQSFKFNVMFIEQKQKQNKNKTKKTACSMTEY